MVGSPVGQPFETFYSREYHPVLALSYALAGSRGAAQNVAHDAFVKARRNWGAIDGPDPGTFVRRSAVRTAGSLGGRLAVAWHRLSHPAPRRSPPESEMEPADQRFWKTLRRCRPRQAQVLALHYVEHLGLDDLARVLGCSPEAAGRDLQSGQLALRRRLGLGEDNYEAGSSDLDPLDSNGQRQLGFEQWAEAAAVSLMQAADIGPPTLDGDVVLYPRAVLTAASILVVAAVGFVALGGPLVHHTGQGADKSSTPVDQEVEAVGVVNQLAGGKYRAVAARYPPGSLASRYPLRTRDQWQHCTTAYGAYKSHGPASGGGGSVTVPVTTTDSAMDISVNFDQNGRLSLIGCAAAAPPEAVSLSRAEAASKAGDVVAQLRAGNYPSVIASLDTLEQTYLDAGRLQSIWESFERAYGTPVGEGDPVWTDSSIGVDVPLAWAHASSHIVVYFDGNYQVSSLSLLLPDASPTAVYGGTVAPSAAAAAVAATMVNELAAGHYGAVAANLDPVGAAETTAAGIQHAWQTTVGPLGRLRRVGTPVLLASSANFLDYQFELQLSHGVANVQIEIDSHNHIIEPIIKPGPATGIAGQ